jgi:hypothetical protein
LDFTLYGDLQGSLEAAQHTMRRCGSRLGFREADVAVQRWHGRDRRTRSKAKGDLIGD